MTPTIDCPIDPRKLIERLERRRYAGIIALEPRELGSDDKRHILLPLVDPPKLTALRHALAADLRAVCDLDGRHAQRSQRVQEQTWPHLTLAQDITPSQWDQGSAIAREEQALLTSLILGTHLALLARDIERGEPYEIIHRVPLARVKR